MKQLAQMGVDFFDLYLHDMPAWMLGVEGMTRAAALGPETPLDAVPRLASLGIELVEAAVIPHEGYGQPLSVADLLAYQQVREATGLPIIVPTQRAIRPEDVSALLDTGVNALMIGVIVTGREAATVREATARFKAAM
jgi:hypothetical protein